MALILTKYIDADPNEVAAQLENAVGRGVDAAANRIGADRAEVSTEGIEGGVRVNSGLDVLDGSELRVGGQTHLTTITINVPWEATDNAKLLAAGAFAETIANEVALAA